MLTNVSFSMLFRRIAAGAVLSGFLMFPGSVSANNPCIPTGTSTADPAPSVFNDTLYLYCTQDANASLGIYNINCWGTVDLVNWISYGAVLTESAVPWDNNAAHLWAPTVVYFGGRYHLYFPETWTDGNFYNGHAYNTTSPHTLFTADAQQMSINGYRSGQAYVTDGLDPYVIMDTGTGGSGNNYLAWCITEVTPNRNYIGLLSADGASVTGAPTQLTNANFYPDGNHYVEGQWWVKANSSWYHIYACYYPSGAEQIGCATANGGGTTAGLTGAYTWRGWLMGTNINSAAGTIHPGCALFRAAGTTSYKWYLFWHCGGDEYGGTLLASSGLRSTGAEQFTFNGTGANAPIVSPRSSTTNWSLPKGHRGAGIPKAGKYPVTDTIHVDRCINNRLATGSNTAGLSIAVRGGSDPLGHMINNVGVGAWAQYDSVDFTPASGRYISGVQVRIASTAARTIEVRRGNSSGALLGTISAPSTGSLTTWTTTAVTTLTAVPTTGVSSLTLVFPGGTANTINVNWLQFQTSPTSEVIEGPVSPASSVLSYQRLNKNTFTVANAAGAEVKLFNMKGQEIVNSFNSSGVDKNLTVKLNSGALSSGSYVLTVKAEKGSARVPFIY